jgi:hypothetical protein
VTDDTLDSRLARLEALLDRVTPASPARPATSRDTHEPSLDASVLDNLAATADRLRALAAEIDSRTMTEEWDAADRLTARLLTEHLAAAVRDCRVVTSAAADQIDLADRAISDIEHALDAQRDREARRAR